ncbi:MAG: hypothetical protein WCK90_04760 [archaeon]
MKNTRLSVILATLALPIAGCLTTQERTIQNCPDVTYSHPIYGWITLEDIDHDRKVDAVSRPALATQGEKHVLFIQEGYEYKISGDVSLKDGFTKYMTPKMRNDFSQTYQFLKSDSLDILKARQTK